MAKTAELGKALADGKGAEMGAARNTLKALLESVNVKSRFHDMLGKKAAGFMSSIISVTNQNKLLATAEPMTIISAAAIAASLDLPILPSLGFAHIVPYKDGASGKVIAQFQMGWRGYVQLAQRTGLYRTMNAGVLKEGQLVATDLLSGEVKVDAAAKKSDKTVGFFAHFELLNGFIKTVFITDEDAKKHGKRYSKSYDKGQWTKDEASYEAMATKTAVKRLLGRWAPLSADYQMQKALQMDQSVTKEIDGAPEFPDNAEALEAETVAPEALPEAEKGKKASFYLCADCGSATDKEYKENDKTVCKKCKSENVTKQEG